MSTQPTALDRDLVLSDEDLREACREWVDEKNDRCNHRAEFILWGKLFPPEALGPRCYSHALAYTDLDAWTLSQSAIFDLRAVDRCTAALRQVRAAIEGRTSVNVSVILSALGEQE